MTISIIVGVFFIVIGALALVAAFAAVDGAVRSRQWPGVPGVVVESCVEEMPGVEGRGYRAVVRYSYTCGATSTSGLDPLSRVYECLATK